MKIINVGVISIIKTEDQYDLYCKRAYDLFGAEPDTTEGDELELLSLLIQDYDDRNYTLDSLDPVDTIEACIEDWKYPKSDYIKAIGSNFSKVMKRKRKLNLRMIRNLNNIGIPLELLIQEY